MGGEMLYLASVLRQSRTRRKVADRVGDGDCHSQVSGWAQFDAEVTLLTPTDQSACPPSLPTTVPDQSSNDTELAEKHFLFSEIQQANVTRTVAAV
ncbi:MAG: hypothetical protein DMD91_02850 [Candidatus Rokuibacteriota bacterium]|nr:MAG: hypothetical protein DMD91_02850 [Candidatus Rokubacteria bacterium]